MGDCTLGAGAAITEGFIGGGAASTGTTIVVGSVGVIGTGGEMGGGVTARSSNVAILAYVLRIGEPKEVGYEVEEFGDV